MCTRIYTCIYACLSVCVLMYVRENTHIHVCLCVRVFILYGLEICPTNILLISHTRTHRLACIDRATLFVYHSDTDLRCGVVLKGDRDREIYRTWAQVWCKEALIDMLNSITRHLSHGCGVSRCGCSNSRCTTH